MQGQLRQHLLVARVTLEQHLEFIGVSRIDHVHHGDAEQVVEARVTEVVQVGLVGTHMHAFVHIGDRIVG